MPSVVLDVCEVRIGDFTLFGSGVHLLTPLHPLDPVLQGDASYRPTPGMTRAPEAALRSVTVVPARGAKWSIDVPV